MFKPTVLEIMDYQNAMDGFEWLGRTSADKKTAQDFVEMWNQEKSLNFE